MAAEAFRNPGDEGGLSPESKRLSEIAERLESGVAAEGAPRGSDGDGCDGDGDFGGVLTGMDISGTAGLRELLEGAGRVYSDPPEA